MKFIVSSSALLKPIQTLSGVLNTTNTLPILDHFLFEVNDNNLRVTATDLETTMSAVINVEADNSGSMALPARLLLETMKTFPEQPLTFIKKENKHDWHKIHNDFHIRHSRLGLCLSLIHIS